VLSKICPHPPIQKISKRRSLLAKIVNKIVFDGTARQNEREYSEAMKEVVVNECACLRNSAILSPTENFTMCNHLNSTLTIAIDGNNLPLFIKPGRNHAIMRT
jgi:hypothetical protein